ncbi:hypothetical protein CC78DRAFT_532535 [Lojkania enalia]|uniref:Glycosyl transferase CAP10 domain-containing protein n=1 Tax=Lojkania enalia TaxID=147567 RepID=A0A9P4KAY8_9PLEO|nr:hypothetical protein CC78DRAFT_532535 [Didymosphaeria enalia]
MARLPRRCSLTSILCVLLLLSLSFILIGTAWLWRRQPLNGRPLTVPHSQERQPNRHPIDRLMETAETEWYKIMAKETHDLSSAAQAYRDRRGRHPPPGFDEWFSAAQRLDVVIIEDFFDQIYHDLAPFWAIEARILRRQAKHLPHVISVRKGKASMNTDAPKGMARDRMNNWLNMTATIQEWLPDVDIPINFMDESRVVVPWEEMNKYMKVERSSRVIIPLPDVVTALSGLEDVDDNPGEPITVEWAGAASYWDLARVGCAPDTPAREVPAATNFSGPPPTPSGFPKGSYYGFVQNWTAAKDPCLQPDLRESHGTFIEPISISTTHSLVPIFGGSKLPLNNEILIPPAMYWTENPFFSGGEDIHGDDWQNKKSRVMWRGSASGGRNRKENWTRFHRHRLVSMLNGTQVRLAERNPEGPGQGPNFVLQSYQTYRLTVTRYMDLGTWLDSVTDAAVVHLVCFPGTGNVKCPYTDSYFEVKKSLDMKYQYGYKYLPDIDGNSYSGRYRGFLRSTSLPIKATIYSEWHDSRLIPWLHFVPMDNSFVDMYGILDYFIGTGVAIINEEGDKVVEGAHDDAAKKIAMAGKDWAERVLRKEDMVIYMMRLLMEYARVCDDQRTRLGFVGDLDSSMGAE